ncbi:hypothetical protein ACFSBV_07055 [Brevibacterium otitidis]
MSEAELRRLPRRFRERERMLARVKEQAAKEHRFLAAAERAYVERVEREARIAAVKERYKPDPEGPARLQALIDEERQAREDAA